MKLMYTCFRALLVVAVVVLGIFAGSYTNPVYAGSSGPCGTCDHTTFELIEGGFCNFTLSGGTCGGNDGGQCGDVPCGG